VDDVRAVLGDFEWSFLAVTSHSYSPDVTGFRHVTAECLQGGLPARSTFRITRASLTSHSWLGATASQLCQVIR